MMKRWTYPHKWNCSLSKLLPTRTFASATLDGELALEQSCCPPPSSPPFSESPKWDVNKSSCRTLELSEAQQETLILHVFSELMEAFFQQLFSMIWSQWIASGKG